MVFIPIFALIACQSAEEDLVPLEEEYGVELVYHEPETFGDEEERANSIARLDLEQVDSMLAQVSASLNEEFSEYTIDRADLAVGQLPLILELDAVDDIHTDIGRLIYASVGWDGEQGENDWQEIDDYERALDWPMLEEATSVRVGMGGIDWEETSTFIMSESDTTVTLRAEGQWFGQFEYEDKVITFDPTDEWQIELDKEEVIAALEP